MSGAAGSNGFVPVAEVVKAVGLKGEVKLYPLLDFHEPLLTSAYLRWDDGTEATLERVRPAGTAVAVKPRSCETREQAEALVGRQLGFQRDDYREPTFPRPAQGLPFRFLDRPVQLADGESLGSVHEVRRYVSQVLLVIEHQGREVMIPVVPPIVDADDALEGPIVVDPPEGLFDA